MTNSPLIKIADLLTRFPSNLKLERGSVETEILHMETPATAKATDIIFVRDEKILKDCQNTLADIWVVPPKLLPLISNSKPTHLLVSPAVYLAMAQIGRAYFLPKWHQQSFLNHAIDPSAIIHPTAQIEEGVKIGPNTTIGASVQIGKGVIIGANSTIEPDVTIGELSHIHSQVFIGYGTKIGHHCEIQPLTSIGSEGFGFAPSPEGPFVRLAHLGRVVIGNHVAIGSGVQMDRGTLEDSKIGDHCIVDNHCHFGHNFKIGKNCIFTGGVLLAGSVEIGDFCIFGGRTTVAGHLKIVSGCQVAGLSGVQESLLKPGKYGGYPIQPLNTSLKSLASLAQLPEIRKNLTRVMKHLGLQSE